MGIYTTEVRKLGIEIFGAIKMSLGLEEICLAENFEQGMHIMGVNSYPPSSQSNIKMGTAAHSDHSIITILLQSHPGLHVMDRADATWKAAPELKGSLQVLVGDHLEVLSNGLYKSVFHRAIPSSEKTRLSVASFHSLGMDEIVEPAMKLVDEKHPKGYKGSSLKDFLMHLSSRQEKRFIETRKIIV